MVRIFAFFMLLVAKMLADSVTNPLVGVDFVLVDINRYWNVHVN